MQAVKVDARAPIAPIERVIAFEEDRGRHRPAAGDSQFHHDVVRQRRCNRLEKFGREIVLVSMPREVRRGESIHDIPQFGGHLQAVQREKVHAGLLDPPPLAFGFLALIGPESIQERIEAAVAAIEPVKLAIFARRKAGSNAGSELIVGRKQNMH